MGAKDVEGRCGVFAQTRSHLAWERQLSAPPQQPASTPCDAISARRQVTGESYQNARNGHTYEKAAQLLQEYVLHTLGKL